MGVFAGSPLLPMYPDSHSGAGHLATRLSLGIRETQESLTTSPSYNRPMAFPTVLFPQGFLMPSPPTLLMPACLLVSCALLLGSGEVETPSSRESLFWVLGFKPTKRKKWLVWIKSYSTKKFWQLWLKKFKKKAKNTNTNQVPILNWVI